MALPTIETITNYYLYGTPYKPQNLDDETLIRGKDEVTEISVDVEEYMAGPGRYVSGACFRQVYLVPTLQRGNAYGA